MVDMPSIPVSLPPQPGPLTTATGGVASQSQNPPNWNFPQGTVLKADMLGTDANGNIKLQSNGVQLVLQTNYNIPKNAQVNIRLEQPLTADSLPSVRIISIDGRPTGQPQPASSQAGQVPTTQQLAEAQKPVGQLLEISARPATAAASQAAQRAAAPQSQVLTAQAARNLAAQISLSPSQTLPAILIRPLLTSKALETLESLNPTPASGTAPVAAATPREQPTAILTPSMLRPGLQLQVRIMDTQPPQTPQAGPVQTSAPNPPAATPAMSPAPTSSATPAAQPVPVPMAEPLQTPASKAAYAAYAKQPPAAAAAASPVPTPTVPQTAVPTLPALQAPLSPQQVSNVIVKTQENLPTGQMTAVVIGKEPAGNLLVQTNLGLFSLPAAPGEAARPGTMIQWQVKTALPAQLLPTDPSTATSQLAVAAQFGHEGSALNELVTLLQSMPTATANQALQRLVPHANANFSAGLMLFVSVIRKGDVGSWLGKELVDQMESLGKGDLIQRLGSELTALRSLTGDSPQPANWQPIFFPIMVGKELEAAQMYVKPDESAKKAGGSGTRFVVELNLSAFGPMQMDGLVKSREQRTYFDLVIRTLAELPEDVRTKIYAIFDDAQQATGMAGSLHFRTVPEFLVHPLEEIQSNAADGSIIA